jgi:hypothetical protein
MGVTPGGGAGGGALTPREHARLTAANAAAAASAGGGTNNGLAGARADAVRRAAELAVRFHSALTCPLPAGPVSRLMSSSNIPRTTFVFAVPTASGAAAAAACVPPFLSLGLRIKTSDGLAGQAVLPLATAAFALWGQPRLAAVIAPLWSAHGGWLVEPAELADAGADAGAGALGGAAAAGAGAAIGAASDLVDHTGDATALDLGALDTSYLHHHGAGAGAASNEHPHSAGSSASAAADAHGHTHSHTVAVGVQHRGCEHSVPASLALAGAGGDPRVSVSRRCGECAAWVPHQGFSLAQSRLNHRVVRVRVAVEVAAVWVPAGADPAATLEARYVRSGIRDRAV